MSSPNGSNHSSLAPQPVLLAGCRFWVSCPALSRGRFIISSEILLFGSSIWLVAKAGLPLCLSIIVMAVVLFTTSYTDVYLPNRTAEITDTVMALLIGALFALSETKGRRNDALVKQSQQDQPLAASERDPLDDPVGGSRTIGPARINNREYGLASWASPHPAFRAGNHSRWKKLAGLVIAAICFALAAAIVVNYPLARRGPLAALSCSTHWRCGAGLPFGSQ